MHQRNVYALAADEDELLVLVLVHQHFSAFVVAAERALLQMANRLHHCPDHLMFSFVSYCPGYCVSLPSSFGGMDFGCEYSFC